MHSKIVVVLIVLCVALCECAEQHEMEGRGKKKKLHLWIYIADLVIKKFFILKLIYAFVFWVVISHAGYLATWFVSYLKSNKHDHHDYHDYHGHDHHHYEYSAPSYGYGPYRRQNPGKKWKSSR